MMIELPQEENFASGHETKFGHLKESLFINYFVITFCFCHVYCNDMPILLSIQQTSIMKPLCFACGVSEGYAVA
jgi:hypothetical protein